MRIIAASKANSSIPLSPTMLRDSDSESERLQQPLNRRTPTTEITRLERSLFGELVAVGYADDGFGIILSPINDQEILPGLAETVPLQELGLSEPVVLSYCVQNCLPRGYVSECHRSSPCGRIVVIS